MTTNDIIEIAYASALEAVAMGVTYDETKQHVETSWPMLSSNEIERTLSEALRDALKQGVEREDIDESWLLSKTKSPRVSHLGGSMYGDGEYVVEFRNVRSTHAPMIATVLTPSGSGYEFSTKQKSVAVAAEMIARVRASEQRKEAS